MNIPMKGASFTPLAVSGIDDRKDTGGSNSHESEYAIVWRMVLSSYQTFSPELFFSLTRSLDLDPQEVKSLTQQYIKRALKSGTIVELATCMDSPVYKVV